MARCTNPGKLILLFFVFILASSAELSSQRMKPMILKPNFPDLVLESFAVSPLELNENDKVELKIIVKNSGKLGVRAFNTQFLLDDRQWLSWPFTGNLAPGGIFAPKIPPQKISGPGLHKIGCRIDPENRIVEIDEHNDEKTVQVKVRAIAQTIPSPDLVLSQISMTPLDPTSETSNIAFELLIQNKGSVNAVIPAATKIVEITFPDGDKQSNTTIESKTYAPGEKFTYRYYFNNASSLEEGNYTVKGVVDPNQKCSEADKSNNEATRSFFLQGPLLNLESVQVEPLELADGGEVTLKCNVENKGHLKAPKYQVSYYIDKKLIISQTGENLSPGNKWHSFQTKVSGVGEHQFSCQLKGGKNPIEESCAFHVRALTKPDLVFDYYKMEPTPQLINQDERVKLSYGVKNIGEAPAAEFLVEIMLDGQVFFSTVQPGNHPQNFLQEYYGYHPGIKDVSKHRFTFYIDPANKVDESDEKNNEKTIEFEIGPPDLQIPNIFVSPEKPTTKDTVYLNVSIFNFGHSEAKMPQGSMAWLVSETPFGKVWFSNKVDKYIDANRGDSFSSVFCDADQLKPGSYTFKVVIDPEGKCQPAETDTNNNHKEFNLVVSEPKTGKADLVIQQIELPTEPIKPNTNIMIKVTILNQGNADALLPGNYRLFQIEPYLVSTYELLPYADTMKPGETRTYFLKGKVSQAGTFEFSCIVNPQKLIDEPADNNIKKFTIVIVE